MRARNYSAQHYLILILNIHACSIKDEKVCDSQVAIVGSNV